MHKDPMNVSTLAMIHDKTDFPTLERLVRMWHDDKELFDTSIHVQMVRLMEETGELARAIDKGSRNDVLDAAGDMQVVLINILARYGASLETSLAAAYSEIRDRKGSVRNGMFIKTEDQAMRDQASYAEIDSQLEYEEEQEARGWGSDAGGE